MRERTKKKDDAPEVIFWKSQGLSTRASKALANRELSSWEGLQSYSFQQILSWPNVGKSTAKEIKVVADARGIDISVLVVPESTPSLPSPGSAVNAMLRNADEPPPDPFDYPWDSFLTFRHVFLLYFTQPEDRKALEHLGNLVYDMALEYSDKWPDWPESPTRAEMRAVAMDLRHAAGYLASIGEERHHSYLDTEDVRLCQMATTWAHMVARIVRGIESVLPPIRGEKPHERQP